MPTQPDFQERLKSIERLLAEIDAVADPNLRSSVHELVQLVMDLHGAGIERMTELVALAPDGGDQMMRRLGRDDLVSSLLILYGLHPVALETRMTDALDKVRLKLRALDGDVELLAIEDGSIRLRIQANGHGCGSTPSALKEIVENAVYHAVPDVRELVIEGAEEKAGFVPLAMLQTSSDHPRDLVLTAHKGVA